VTLAQLALELGIEERTIRRDVQSLAAKLRPLFAIANSAERAWILAEIQAHLRGETFFSTEAPAISRAQCPIPRRWSDAAEASRVDTSPRSSSDLFPDVDRPAGSLPRRFRSQNR
jgi:hypothetical protein